MKILITFGEINQKGNFLKFCNDKGINPWCMNEGLVDSNEKVELTIEEAKKYGILPTNFGD